MSEELRVAAVVSYFPTDAEPHSGMPIFNQMKAMARMTDLTVYVVRPQYPNARFLHPRSFLHRKYDPEYKVAGINVRYIGYPAIPFVSRVLNGRTCASRLLPHIRAARPDVLLSYIVYPEGNAAVRVGKALNIPIVVGAVGSDLRRIPDPWTRSLVKSTLRKADSVVTKSRELRTQAIRLGASQDKVFAILNGCDANLFCHADRDTARAELGVNPKSKLVVFTGRLVEVKGLRELVEAVAIARDAGESLEVALLGDGPLRPQLAALCQQRNVEDKFHFRGACSPVEVARWLAACNVFCLPSYSEGCPNVVLEALSCGRPVVASDVGGIPEIVDSTCGILVPPANPKALATGLLEAFSRTWNETQIARSYGRDWSDMAHETLEVCALAARRTRSVARFAIA